MFAEQICRKNFSHGRQQCDWTKEGVLLPSVKDLMTSSCYIRRPHSKVWAPNANISWTKTESYVQKRQIFYVQILIFLRSRIYFSRKMYLLVFFLQFTDVHICKQEANICQVDLSWAKQGDIFCHETCCNCETDCRRQLV